MKINANLLKVGNIIIKDTGLWRVTKAMSVKPGKGGAFRQVELKNIATNTKTTDRFRSGQDVELATVYTKKYQFLYIEHNNFIFMDNETYEQITLTSDQVSKEQAKYLKDGLEVLLDVYEEKAIGLKLPDNVVLEIAETEHTIKGQTATGSYKSAKLSNGVLTQVPPYINIGDKVTINTENDKFVSRHKSNS